MTRGRPRVANGKSRQVSVLVPEDEYRLLEQLVQSARVSRPGFTMGDLLRDFVRTCLSEIGENPLPDLSPRESRVRRLHALSRGLTALARELETAEDAATD